MSLSHIVVLVIAVVAGYWLHSKFPGLLSKVSGGIVSA